MWETRFINSNRCFQLIISEGVRNPSNITKLERSHTATPTRERWWLSNKLTHTSINEITESSSFRIVLFQLLVRLVGRIVMNLNRSILTEVDCRWNCRAVCAVSHLRILTRMPWRIAPRFNYNLTRQSTCPLVYFILFYFHHIFHIFILISYPIIKAPLILTCLLRSSSSRGHLQFPPFCRYLVIC